MLWNRRRQLRTDETAGLATKAFAAESGVENAMASIKLGAFDYLTKPFKLDQLMAAINRADERIDAMIASEGHDSNFALL